MDYSEYYLINYGLPILGILITAIAQFFVTSSYNKYKKKKTEISKKGSEVVRLSRDIYEGTSIASVSVAAHECGHAIQHKVGYTPLKIRSALVPVVNFSTKFGYIIVMIGIIFGALNLAIIGLILLLGMLLFQLVTLPVEFNASKRAKEELSELHILTEREQSGSGTMLKAAAFTYVAGVLTTFLQVLRLALIAFSRSDDR